MIKQNKRIVGQLRQLQELLNEDFEVLVKWHKREKKILRLVIK